MSYGKKKSIEITIETTGDVQVEAMGYTDGSCRTATDAIEKALGGVNTREMKDHRKERKEREKVTS